MMVKPILTSVALNLIYVGQATIARWIRRVPLVRKPVWRCLTRLAQPISVRRPARLPGSSLSPPRLSGGAPVRKARRRVAFNG